MAATDGGDRKIKVVDRRWFDETGELRRELSEARSKSETSQVEREPATPAEDAEVAGAPPTGSSADRNSGPKPSSGGVAWPSAISFLQMVDFLAQQALLLLSGAEGHPASPEQARIFIDFLGILEDRTRGNLTPEEARALADVLFQLRALYVQTTGG